MKAGEALTFVLEVSEPQLVLTATVDADPVPWSRAGHGRLGQSYTPARYRAWRDQVAWAMRAGYRGKPLTVELGVWATFRRRTRRHVDLDNLAKAVLDAGTGIAWGDDHVITLLLCRLLVEPDRPGLELVVYRRDVEGVSSARA